MNILQEAAKPIGHLTIADIDRLQEFVRLYWRTYAETQTHPTAMQEAMVLNEARELIGKIGK